jgi:hypothetical protein
MLGKALTTAVLLAATLAAPQAQAGSAFSTTIVIGSIPTSRIAHQGGYRDGHTRPAHPRALIRYERHYWGFARHHGLKRHLVKHHAAPAHRDGRHPRKPGHRSRH